MTFTLFIYLCYSFFLSSTSTQHKVEYTVSTTLTFDEFEGDYVMYFDNNTSYFYNETLVNIPRTIKNDGGTSVIFRANDKDGFPIYKNLRDQKISYKYFLLFDKNKCVVNETLPKITWKITKETKKIKGLDCYKAYGLHGGRDYEVWFAPSMAVGHGPFALSGLPGLILEARTIDGRGHHHLQIIATQLFRRYKDTTVGSEI